MNPELRVLMETSLETFEGGLFQDFCLDLLPIYHPRFKSLARLGHTASGKTRAGTPDLLVTAPLRLALALSRFSKCNLDVLHRRAAGDLSEAEQLFSLCLAAGDHDRVPSARVAGQSTVLTRHVHGGPHRRPLCGRSFDAGEVRFGED